MPSGSSSRTFRRWSGRELLVALAQRNGLRGLHETAGAVGILLEIHSPSSARFLRPYGTGLSAFDYGKRGSTDLPADEAQHRPETFPTGDIGRFNSGKRGLSRRRSGCIDEGRFKLRD